MSKTIQEIPPAAAVSPIPGDMIGDKFVIGSKHEQLADVLAPFVLQKAIERTKTVIAVGGPSGSGKSETAALLAGILTKVGLSAYTLSCDNYPLRPPRSNERHRAAIFADGGAASLQEFLGTANEIDFARLIGIVAAFRMGAPELQLRIMDNGADRVAEDQRVLDCRPLRVLLLEGTWSNLVTGVDLKLFLYSTPAETLAHRIARGRDPNQDDPLSRAVLAIEQEKLESIAKTTADLVIDSQGRVLRSPGQ